MLLNVDEIGKFTYTQSTIPLSSTKRLHNPYRHPYHNNAHTQLQKTTCSPPFYFTPPNEHVVKLRETTTENKLFCRMWSTLAGKFCWKVRCFHLKRPSQNCVQDKITRRFNIIKIVHLQV